MLNPWVILAVVLAWGASLAGVGYWQRHDGAQAEKSSCQADKLAANAASAKALAEANAATRAEEQRSATELALVEDEAVKGQEDAEAKRRHDVAAARSGAISLRVPATCPGSGAGSAPQTSPGPGGSDGAATAELPREVTADLLALADDADAIVGQLAACQAVVKSDRAPEP